MADSVEREIRELRSLFWSERDPDGRAFASLADAYRRRGDLDQALEVLDDGLGRHADFSPGHVVAGWVHRARGEAEQAERSFDAALALDDENTEALRGLGELASERGDTGRALECWRRLAELEPGDAEVRARLSEAEAPQPEEALGSVATAGFEGAAFEPPPFEAPPFEAADASSGEDDPWGADPERVRETDDVAHTTDEVVATADDFFLDVGPPAEAGVGEVRIEPEPADQAAAEWSATPSALEDEDGVPVTRTMADLYARQRLHGRALRLYRRLLERAPEDAELADRVREMEALAAAESEPAAPLADWPPPAEPEPAPAERESTELASGTTEDVGAYAPPAVPETEPAPSSPPGPPRSATRPPRRTAEDDVEALARDWAEGPGHVGELSTPFAWASRAAQPPARPQGGRPIADYFRDLLAWEPSADADRQASEADEPGLAASDAGWADPAVPPSEREPVAEEPGEMHFLDERAAAESALAREADAMPAPSAWGALPTPEAPAPTWAPPGLAEPADELEAISPAEPAPPTERTLRPEPPAPGVQEPESVAIEALAPDAGSPDVIDIESLAPEGGGGGVVAIESLGPDHPPTGAPPAHEPPLAAVFTPKPESVRAAALMVADGAPAVIVPIESLAPTVVDVAALAPDAVDIDSLAPGKEPGPQDDFAAWLRKLS